MKRPCCLSSGRLVRLLFIVFASAVLPALAEAPLQADEATGTRARFVELDSEIQAIKQEILAINQEILLLEESSLVSHGEQLVVLVSIAAGSTVAPEQITLLIDGETLSRHDYSGAVRRPPSSRAGFTGYSREGSVTASTNWRYCYRQGLTMTRSFSDSAVST